MVKKVTFKECSHSANTLKQTASILHYSHFTFLDKIEYGYELQNGNLICSNKDGLKLLKFDEQVLMK